MPLVFLPDIEALFLWGTDTDVPALAALHHVEPWSTTLVTPVGRRNVEGRKLPLHTALVQLAAVTAHELQRLPGSAAIWSLASKLVLDLVARERVVPCIIRRQQGVEARWAASLAASEDAARVSALAKGMPPAAHAVPVAGGGARAVWAPDALLRAFLDANVDMLVRPLSLAPTRTAGPEGSWPRRWRAALTGRTATFETQGFNERTLLDDLQRWSEPALGARDRLRSCFRMETSETEPSPFMLRFLLQSPDDPSLLVTAAEVWKSQGRVEKLGSAFRDPLETLLEALGRAAQLFPPIAAALQGAHPDSVELSPEEAWQFLGVGATSLSEAGFGVMVPGELTASGQRRLRLKMRIGGTKKVAGVVAGAAGLTLPELLAVDWEAVIGDHRLTPGELTRLAKHKAPLVRFRGAWVVIDPTELSEIRKRLTSGPSTLDRSAALRAVLTGETKQGELSVAVEATGSLASVLERLRNSTQQYIPPAALNAQLRPYQERGVRWLVTMASLGFGACLADDMGLGKTIQLLAFLLSRIEAAPKAKKPTLLVAPTSVVGNWEREIERFAPSLRVLQHYGADRTQTVKDIPKTARCVVLTNYGVLRRDQELLRGVSWSVVALDEAQNIKNSASASAHAARSLSADARFALTGTPVENRLAELWSIFEFTNPGLLGPLGSFRREFAVPIERHGNDEQATRLRRIVDPFVLRRLKSDPNVIQDLPPKQEMKVVCTLTPEQATLYKAVVDEELRQIEASEGMKRKGRVLALLMYTKQICNHPAHYLGESGPLPRRSGKLSRITEMLEEVVSAGDKALVFTQFREMGDKLVAHLQETLGVEIQFLHGGTGKKLRDEMVRRFQEESDGPRVFVLSVKAGGTGLNLTAASHVFHFDRWWNPAVEDQATDRAYRIGQSRTVQVHKLVCAGTVEEKVDRLLEQKRELASKVVGAGERWITELDGAALEDLFALSGGVITVADEDETETPSKPRRRRNQLVEVSR